MLARNVLGVKSLLFSTVRRCPQRRLLCTEHINDTEFKLEHLNGDDKGIAVFCMKKPETRNAFSRKMVREMRGAINTVQNQANLRAVIIRSDVPGIFCAGADLKERIHMTPQEVKVFLGSLRQTVADLAELPIPTIAALDGAAMGGGLEMALMCDMRTAADNARMGLVETRLAIIPGGGGTQRLPRLIGPARAKEMIFTAKVVAGNEAEAIGLVNHVVDQNDDGDAAYQRALELAREILPNGPVALRMAKVAIDKGLQVDINTGMDIEKLAYAQVIPTADRIEGLTAFKQKRKPVYMGE